jgi:hypothetical protein
MVIRHFYRYAQRGSYRFSTWMLSFSIMIALVVCIPLGSKLLAFAEESTKVRSEASYIEPFFPEGTYDPAIPTPESVLGFPMGSKPCQYQEVASYFKTLGESTPRARLSEYGVTYEGRILYYLIISSEENMGKLEEIKSSIAKLADPRKIRQESEASSLIKNTPAIAWMAYSVHGDELSSTDAAVQLAYQLASGTDSLTRKLRNELVIIIDPLQNPDGRERFLKQMEMWSGALPNWDDQSLQHGGFWPWGRGNHYLFDLNRDWFALTQPETFGKVKAVLQWNPQLLVDGHEMDALNTHLFSPPREPFHPSMTNTLKKWWKIFSLDQAQAFDRYGWSYYTREWSDMWYPGYANSWSLYTGAVSILYEQAGVQGSAVRQKDGRLLTYGESVHHQFVSSLANLKTTAENRQELLKDFYNEKKKAIKGEENNPIQTFLFVPGDNKSRADRLMETLLLQGIEVQRAKDDFVAGNVHDFWGRSYSGKRFPKGTYLVFLDQPLRPLIQAILGFDPHMSQSFLEEERQKLEKEGQTQMYEVSAWSVPMAYNVETYWSKSHVSTVTEKVTRIDQTEGKVVSPHPQYGFVFDYSDDKAVDALTSLLKEDLKIRVAEKPFQIEGKSFSHGSILLRVDENPKNLHEFLSKIAKESGITVYGVNTALAEEGPDLGGNYFRLLEQPRIGLFAGPPIDFTSYGSIWYLLDQRLGIRFSSLDLGSFWRVDFDKYNVLILPSAWGGTEAYLQILGEGGMGQLRKWIENGGTLIAIGTSAAFAADSTVKLSQVRLRQQTLDKLTEYEEAVKLEKEAEKPLVDTSLVWNYPAKKEEKSEGSKKAKEKPKSMGGLEELKREDERQRVFMPRGVILRANLDQESWLTSGMDDKVPVILYTEFAFMSQRPVETPARLAGADSLRLSGLFWPEAQERWEKTAYLTKESLGKGQIILFAFEPNFRGYFHGSERLLINALLFGPGLGTYKPAPW